MKSLQMTAGGDEAGLHRVTVIVLGVAAANLWLTALLRTDRSVLLNLVLAVVMTATVLLVAVAPATIVRRIAPIAPSLCILVLISLVMTTGSDTFRMLDACFMIALGAYTGFCFREPLVFSLFVGGALLFIVAAVVTANDRTAVAWSVTVAIVLAVLVARVFGGLRRRLQDAVITDPLTGVLNRRGIVNAIETEISRSSRAQDAVTIIMMDIDSFKKTNDNRGHAAGDEVLILFASTWRSLIRPHDVMGRLGGDEFVVLLPESDQASGTAILDRVRATVSIPFSAGVARLPARGLDVDELLAAGDRAMYIDKHLRRNAVGESDPVS